MSQIVVIRVEFTYRLAIFVFMLLWYSKRTQGGLATYHDNKDRIRVLNSTNVKHGWQICKKLSPEGPPRSTVMR